MHSSPIGQSRTQHEGDPRRTRRVVEGDDRPQLLQRPQDDITGAPSLFVARPRHDDYAVAPFAAPLRGPPGGVSDAARARRPATGATNNPTEAIATKHPAKSTQISDQARTTLARPPRALAMQSDPHECSDDSGICHMHSSLPSRRHPAAGLVPIRHGNALRLSLLKRDSQLLRRLTSCHICA